MNLFSTDYFKSLASGLLLLGALISTSSAHAEFGLSGLEFSPVRTFASANGHGYRTYSGTVNFELNNPRTELSVPFVWSKHSAQNEFEDTTTGLVMDLQWRIFDEASRNGGYVGVLMRGVTGENKSSSESNRASDVGLGLVAGFRRNISSGFYWGANISLVAFAEEPDSVDLGEADIYRQKVSMTFDFLKIGYQFN